MGWRLIEIWNARRVKGQGRHDWKTLKALAWCLDCFPGTICRKLWRNWSNGIVNDMGQWVSPTKTGTGQELRKFPSDVIRSPNSMGFSRHYMSLRSYGLERDKRLVKKLIACTMLRLPIPFETNRYQSHRPNVRNKRWICSIFCTDCMGLSCGSRFRSRFVVQRG